MQRQLTRLEFLRERQRKDTEEIKRLEREAALIRARADVQIQPPIKAQQREILALRDQGFDVQEFAPYHFRIDGHLDLYTAHRRFHYLPEQIRGSYRSALAACRKFLRGEDVEGMA